MEKSAIVHEMNGKYCFVNDNEKFVFRVKTKKDDCVKVIFHCRDKYIEKDSSDMKKHIDMSLYASDGVHDYFQAEVELKVLCLRYFFELIGVGGETIYYGNYRFYKEMITDISKMFDCPQKKFEEEKFNLPKWAKGKVAYQIFVDRFARENDIYDDYWYHSPVKLGQRFGGSIKGITDRLDYLSKLGIDILYLTPIFRADTDHKYDTIDYYMIDPDFGKIDDLRELVYKAHEHGMYVVLDAVFNHTSRKFFAFEDILKKQDKSEYVSWYHIDGFPVKDNYLTFAYYGGMPKLNTCNESVMEYLCEVAKYWIRECNIDGWRLDVGDEISHIFWKKFRKEVKSLKDDALIVGETWLQHDSFLQGDEWDSMMNYQYKEAVDDYVVKGGVSAGEFAERLGQIKGNMHSEVLKVLWNILDSHDTSRLMYDIKLDEERFILASTMHLLSYGSPMIYYGDELGMTGAGDPDCRRGMLWDSKKQNQKIFETYKTLLSVRKKYSDILIGEQKILYTDDENGIVAEERKNDDKKVIIVYHNGAGNVLCKRWAGCYNVIKEELFNGEIGPYETVFLI